MITEQWKASAEKLSLTLPSGLPISQRIEYLLGTITPRAIEVDASTFDGDPKLEIVNGGFLVTDRESLGKSKSKLGTFALNLEGVAFVAWAPNLPSVLALPQYDPTKPLGNGLIFTHELEHVTEKEEGLFGASIGARERRAYRLNSDSLSAIDGSDLDSYIDKWPVTFTKTDNITNISFHDIATPEPPKETYLHDVWSEAGTSQNVLKSIGRMAVFEKLVLGLPDNVADQLADGLSV